MPVTRSSGSTAKKKKSSSFGGGSGIFRLMIKIVFGVIVGLFVLGIINQAATGKFIIDWYAEMGGKVGHAMVYVFTGSDKSPVSTTDQGVYLKGHEPKDAKKGDAGDIADNISKQKDGTAEKAKKGWDSV